MDGGTSTEVAAWDFLRERGARVDSQWPRGRVYDRRERAGEGDGGSRPGLWKGTHTGSRQSTTLVGHPIPRPSSATYVSPDPGGDLWNRWNVAACPADGRPCSTLTRGFLANPSGDGSRLFYLRDTGAARNMRDVWTVSVDGRNPRRVAALGPLAPEWTWDVSRKDQIVFTRLNASRRELWVAQLKE